MNLWSLIPINVRLGIYAAIALLVIGLGLGAKYVYSDWQRLKIENKAQSQQIVKLGEYVERYDRWTKVKEKGSADAISKIHQNKNNDITPPVIADSIAGLPKYGDLLPR